MVFYLHNDILCTENRQDLKLSEDTFTTKEGTEKQFGTRSDLRPNGLVTGFP